MAIINQHPNGLEVTQHPLTPTIALIHVFNLQVFRGEDSTLLTLLHVFIFYLFRGEDGTLKPLLRISILHVFILHVFRGHSVVSGTEPSNTHVSYVSGSEDVVRTSQWVQTRGGEGGVRRGQRG